MKQIKAWVASAPKSKFVQQEMDLGPLGDEEVEVAARPPLQRHKIELRRGFI